MPAAPRAFDLVAQQREHLPRGVGVEIAGRLVGKHEARIGGRARARSRRAAVRRPKARAACSHARSPRPTATSIAVDPCAAAACRSTPVSESGKRDVLRDRQIRQNVERLEDEAHAVAPKRGQRIVVERGELDAVDRDRARVGAVEPGHEIEQRGLADARLAHHGDEVAGRELEIDVAEDGARPRPRERLGKAADREHLIERNGGQADQVRRIFACRSASISARSSASPAA